MEGCSACEDEGAWVVLDELVRQMPYRCQSCGVMGWAVVVLKARIPHMIDTFAVDAIARVCPSCQGTGLVEAPRDA